MDVRLDAGAVGPRGGLQAGRMLGTGRWGGQRPIKAQLRGCPGRGMAELCVPSSRSWEEAAVATQSLSSMSRVSKAEAVDFEGAGSWPKDTVEIYKSKGKEYWGHRFRNSHSSALRLKTRFCHLQVV